MSRQRAAQRSNAEWDRLVDEWIASGKKQQQYSVEKGINPKTFQGQVCRSRKRRGISIKGAQRPYRFVEISPSTNVESKQRGQCRISISTTQIDFTSSSDAKWISEVVSRLGIGK